MLQHSDGERQPADEAAPGSAEMPAPARERRRAPLRLELRPLEVSIDLRRLATDAIKRAITEMDIYGHRDEIKLDEQQLCHDLGVSRTPVREALRYLEQEGLVRSVPRRGVFVVRKTKREIIEMITVWAAIESMAARFAATRASPANLAALRGLFTAFADDPSAQLGEYSQANMTFHRAIIRMGGCALMTEITDGLFVHMRAVRAVTMGQDNRAQRSLIDHRNIIDALERRDPDRAAELVRAHTLGLAEHVERHGDALDFLPARAKHSGARPRARATDEGSVANASNGDLGRASKKEDE